MEKIKTQANAMDEKEPCSQAKQETSPKEPSLRSENSDRMEELKGLATLFKNNV